MKNDLRHSHSRNNFRKRIRQSWQFYLMMLLPMAYIIIFAYIPMPGILMAFERYSPVKGLFGSRWIGLQNFNQFFATPSGPRIIINTLRLGIYTLIAGFPIPILLAIGLNEVGGTVFKKTVQMATYAPYFISTVVVVGIIFQITSLRSGVINTIIQALGHDRINFMSSPRLFPSLYVWSGIWQNSGYSAIIYLAALAGVDKEIQEAAIVDGASRLKRIWHIDIPAISTQILIILIFSVSGILGVGFEKVYLLQNTLNITTSEVIATFVYKVGLINADYGFSTAVGLFNTVISLILLLTTNAIVKKLSDTGIW